jgi:ATP-binding cassette, subfamily C, bacterial
VSTVAALAQALGLLLLIPLLEAIRVGASAGIAEWTRDAFETVGLKPTLGVVLTIYIAVTAVAAGLTAYQSVLSTRYRLEFVNHLRRRLYSGVAEAEWPHLMGLRRPDLLAVLTANVNLVGAGAMACLGIAVAAIVVTAQVAVAIQISPLMTALAIASGAVLVIVVWPLVRRSRSLGAELVQLNRTTMRRANGFLEALKLAKAYGREQEHQLVFNDAITRARDVQVSFARASGVASAVQGTLTAALLGATVYVAVKVAHVPVGSLLVVTVVFMRVVAQIIGAQGNVQQVAQALPAFDEVMALIESCEAAREAPEPARLARARVGIGNGVALDGVHFAYPRADGDSREALCGVSIEIPAGSTVALAGPSGAGKTTTADLVAGLMLPNAGNVVVDGKPLTPERLLAWRRSIALVPQDPFLFHEPIEDNLRWAQPAATEDDLWEALRMANASEFVRELPSGLRTVVGDRGMRLSGGERQRLALARALLRDPDLLILDEATSAMDTENELAIRRALASLKGRTTILLIAHRLSTVSEADSVVVLDRGRVIETGTWAELAGLQAGRLQSLIEAGALAVV